MKYVLKGVTREEADNVVASIGKVMAKTPNGDLYLKKYKEANASNASTGE